MFDLEQKRIDESEYKFDIPFTVTLNDIVEVDNEYMVVFSISVQKPGTNELEKIAGSQFKLNKYNLDIILNNKQLMQSMTEDVMRNDLIDMIIELFSSSINCDSNFNFDE